ncbi:hypothetical protein [Spirillospora sp. CA-294931]|uniref:hypothetical protein n=1 Tax=Spirillospora sp. CA-294931 TaxID=3240042 RepID=UPI003D8CEDD1
MTRGTRTIESWGDRLLSRIVPSISAHAGDSWYEDCSCRCHTICQRQCKIGYGGRITCGSCNVNCRYTAGCSSC